MAADLFFVGALPLSLFYLLFLTVSAFKRQSRFTKGQAQGFRKIRSFGLSLVSWLTDPFLFCAFSCLLAVPFLSFGCPFPFFCFLFCLLVACEPPGSQNERIRMHKGSASQKCGKLNTRKPSTGYRSLCVAGFVCVGVPCPSGRSFPSLSFPVCHCRCHI